MPDSTVPVSLHWTHGGKKVLLVGSFSNWKTFLPMEQEEGSKVFSKLVYLSNGIHSYKFVVDGEWKYCPDHEQIRDQSGNINNCIYVNDTTTKGTLLSNTPKLEKRFKSRNHVILPDTEISQRKTSTGFLIKSTSIGNLATYASGFQHSSGVKLMLVMVGLPARGKSCISKKLCRYLNWLGYKTKIFNLGSYRREKLGAYQNHNWYRGDNKEGVKARTEMAEAALADLFKWYENENGSVTIFDGTNSTRSRRELIIQRIKEVKENVIIKPIFVEIICNNEDTIRRNVIDTKTSSPDYKDTDPDQIIKDFTERIQHYKDAYQTIQKDENLRYIKILNVGRQIVANRITGFVPAKMLFYLSNLHITPRPIYLVRHGQSEYNLEDRIGGDSPLTNEGLRFSKRLKTFLMNEFPNAEEELCVWSSTMLRTTQTSKDIPCCQYIRWKTMEEIHAGECDGMTYKEIEETMPDEFIARRKDKLRYRYPRGESYEDVIRRVEPVIVELERQQKPVLVVAHRAILRCLYAYFKDVSREQVPHIDMPLNVLVKLQPGAYGTSEEKFDLSGK